MELRRVILFFALSMAVLIVWTRFVAPAFFPAPNNQPNQVEQTDEDANPQPKPADKPDDAPLVAQKPKEPDAKADAKPLEPMDQPPKPEPPAKQAATPKRHPFKVIKLGSVDPKTGYFFEAEATTVGAGIESITFSDPRFPSVDAPKQQLTILNPVKGIPASLATFVHAGSAPEIKDYLDTAVGVNWKIATQHTDAGDVPLIEADPKVPGVNRAVTFELDFPESQLRATKTYRLKRSEQTGNALLESRKTYAPGYELTVEFTIRNLAAQPQTAVWQMQGPTGIPLENETGRVTRNIQTGFLDDDGNVDLDTLSASKILEKSDSEDLAQFGSPLSYVGIDVQYFAALIVPGQNQQDDQTIEAVLPILTSRANKKPQSDISFVMQSREFNLLPSGAKTAEGKPGDRTSQTLTLYVGPKRGQILEAFHAGDVLNYGTFGALAGIMLVGLNWLNGVGIHYGIAIVILTMVVRLGMFPLTRKQTIGAQKMKELQPKLKEIKKKYAKDKEKLARAQMELFRKHNYNPLSGCLPMFIQLPIFISLYTALNTSVDLRMEPFLWFDNLAAPDALFQLPFDIPFLGNKLNLLPILTIALFIGQQKIMMPPAEDPETAAQQKMMKYVMVFMGFLFYNVPSGLCIYFIASSLWGLGERKLLDHLKKKADEVPKPVPQRA